MENRYSENLRLPKLVLAIGLGVLSFQAALADVELAYSESVHAKSVVLTGKDAQILYESLSWIVPEPNTLTKKAHISFIQQYDGPGPFSYLMIYADPTDQSKTYKIEFPENMTKDLVSLFEALYLDDKGLAVHGNPPHYTQTITEAFATCAMNKKAQYRCVVRQ